MPGEKKLPMVCVLLRWLGEVGDGSESLEDIPASVVLLC